MFGDAPPIASLILLANLARSALKQLPPSPITPSSVIPTLVPPAAPVEGDPKHPIDVDAPRIAPSIIDLALMARTLLSPSPETPNPVTPTLVSPTTAPVEGEQQQQQQLVNIGTLAAQKTPVVSSVTEVALPTPDSETHYARPVSTGSPRQVTLSAPASPMSIKFDFESRVTDFPIPASTSSEGSDEGSGSPMSISPPAADLETSVDTNQSMSEPVSSPLSDRSATRQVFKTDPLTSGAATSQGH
ncbi:hypothetical protein QBC45DRAFT_74583 [Copromyces sp. CBS 386.78]|nr:hypothetical protein QBC45DRAFT_74583 [Copromyces sp. CBS 386.78]